MYVAIDIGGTKTLVASFDEHGTLLDKTRFPTPHEYHEFLQKTKKAAEDLPGGQFRHGAIGMPGLIDRVKGSSNWSGGNLAWKHHPIADDTAKLIGCPFVVENDANTAALSEARLVRDTYQTALYVTISTGIGSGFVVDGQLDPTTLDAEVGHMIFPDKEGYKTWEQMASGGTIVETYGQRADEITNPAIWRAITEQLAIGLINLSATLTPEVIIIGGGAGGQLDRFHTYLDEHTRKLAPYGVRVPPIVRARHAEEAVIYGCYELAKQASHHAKAD